MHFLELIDDPPRRALIDDLLGRCEPAAGSLYARHPATLARRIHRLFHLLSPFSEFPIAFCWRRWRPRSNSSPSSDPLTACVDHPDRHRRQRRPGAGRDRIPGCLSRFSGLRPVSAVDARAAWNCIRCSFSSAFSPARRLAGVPGAFLSVPVLALVRIIYRRIRQRAPGRGLLAALARPAA